MTRHGRTHDTQTDETYLHAVLLCLIPDPAAMAAAGMTGPIFGIWKKMGDRRIGDPPTFFIFCLNLSDSRL